MFPTGLEAGLELVIAKGPRMNVGLINAMFNFIVLELSFLTHLVIFWLVTSNEQKQSQRGATPNQEYWPIIGDKLWKTSI